MQYRKCILRNKEAETGMFPPFYAFGDCSLTLRLVNLGEREIQLVF